MIYLKLMGRIGNQLFMYAAARTIQYLKGMDEPILIEDYLNCNHEDRNIFYENSLVNYKLKNVRYVHDLSEFRKFNMLPQRLMMHYINRKVRRKSNREVFEFETSHQKIFSAAGVYRATDGYIPYPSKFKKNTYVNGYFQSEKYFEPIKDEIIETFSLKEEVEQSTYPNLDLIKNRNTVCISIKIQHNVGNKMYDVCNNGYYEQAINMITKKVQDPLFFICSDNVGYVINNLIDINKYDVVLQDSAFPVHISLAVMAQCKHFIIGNTSFGWWAQYLSQYSDKIVIAPSRWYGIDVPCDIYQDNWEMIKV